MPVRRLVLLASLVASVGCGGEELHIGSTTSAIDISLFKLPTLAVDERTTIIRSYDALDPGDLVPRGLLEDALLYLETNAAHIPRKDYLVIVDLSLFSGKDRFWLVDLATGAVEGHKVSHGSGSDPDHDGYATKFSNTSGSHMSSLGFALTAEIYDGNHPHSMRLDGLTATGGPNGMANSKMRSRAIVVHEASYVDDNNTAKQGRSQGCFALDSAIEADVVDRIHDGTLFYTAKSALNPPVGRAVCGDGTCDGNETAISCSADCQGSVDPGDTDPGDTNPDTTDPDTTDPDTTDPAATDPDTTDPAATDPAATDPAATEPGSTDPGMGGGRLGPAAQVGQMAGGSSLVGGCAMGGDVGADWGLLLLGILWVGVRRRRPKSASEQARG